MEEVNPPNTIKQEESEATCREHELLIASNAEYTTTPLLESPCIIITVKEEDNSDTSDVITIKHKEQDVNIKEEEQELPVTVWKALHQTTPCPVNVESLGTITKIKEEAKPHASQTQDTQPVNLVLQDSVKANLARVKDDDTGYRTLKLKPSDTSKLCVAREVSARIPDRNPAEIEVCVDVEDLSCTRQDMLYPGKTSPQKKCHKRKAVSDLNGKLPRNSNKGSQCSFKASAETIKVLGQDYAENMQEKEDAGTSEMSVSNKRKFALSVLRDQCLKVITQWYMGQPFSEIVHNMNLNPDSVRHILHVWCTEKRLACHKPGQSKIKGKIRTRKGQVPTLWKWRFLVAVGKNSALQCMVCDRRLNSAKMDNIACHIRNWHPYSAELPQRVRRAIHQAWKRRQGLHKLQELQANCTEKHEMTNLQNEQDKMTSISLSVQQNAPQKPDHYSHVQKMKKTINDSRLCNQTEDYAVQQEADNEEKREINIHQKYNIQSNENNIQQAPSKKQKQIRYFQDEWRQKYLVDYDWKAEEVVCLVCGLRMRCLRSCTFARHAQRRHPESIHYSKETRNSLWESWNKGQHSFPLLNAASGMSDFKVCRKRIESQPSLIKHCDPGLQECQKDCTEEVEIKRPKAMQAKWTPTVQHIDRPPIQNCVYVQEKQNTIIENRLNNQVEDYAVQYVMHNEDKEPDIHFKQSYIQHIRNTHTPRKQNKTPQGFTKKQKHMRNFQEHWRQKYMVDYDWKTEEAICILCGLHMRSLRSCTFERHAHRRHPESVHYSEETRNALWRSWNKGEHIYPLRHTGGSVSDTDVCKDEMETQPHWPENPGPSMNTEEYMAIQQEQIESVLKSTNSQNEVCS